MKESIKKIIPVITLILGLALGLGVGHLQVVKEQKISQGKLKEANRKLAFMQSKITEGNNDAATAASIQQQCLADKDKLSNEKKAADGQLGKLKAQLAMKVKEADEAAVKADKKFRGMEGLNKDLGQELKKTTEERLALQSELKKANGEFSALQSAFKKTTESLSSCDTKNARLCIISEELLKKYRNRGLGSVLLQSEPLTQLKKVELEHLIQQYQEEIAQQKINQKEATKNAKQN